MRWNLVCYFDERRLAQADADASARAQRLRDSLGHGPARVRAGIASQVLANARGVFLARVKREAAGEVLAPSPFWGNHCGAGHGSPDQPAVDRLDRICKSHDAAYEHARRCVLVLLPTAPLGA